MSNGTINVSIALLHMYPALGDIQSNLSVLQSMTTQALQGGAKFVIAPELATTGYSITADQVQNGLGFQSPFSEFDPLSQLAQQYDAYVALGFAEIGANGNLYNSAILLKPDGSYYVQRKRGVALWNVMGDTPFDTVDTPYGKVGLVICSDTYLMDCPRILTLKEADIVLAPANWWGQAQQLNIWTTRTLENSVFFLVANRWGVEVDDRFPPNEYIYNMNDAPSAIVDMSGNVLLSFMMNETQKPYQNKLLTGSIDVPSDRVSSDNTVWSLINRVPRAYVSLANTYYVRDAGNQPIPGLPTAGIVQTCVMAYTPVADSSQNMRSINGLWNAQSVTSDIVLLPPNGLTSTAAIPDAQSAPWNTLVQFVQTQQIQLLVTSTVVPPEAPQTDNQQALVVIEGDGTLTTIRPVSDPTNALPNLRWPAFFDINQARIGVVLGSDDFFPEMGLSLAKNGIDVLVAPVILPPSLADPSVSLNNNISLLQTRNNDVVHLAVMSNSATGFVIVNGGGYIESNVSIDAADGMKVVALDASLVRTKFLNSYYTFDLQTLLGEEDAQTAVAEAKRLPLLEGIVSDEPQHALPPGLSHPIYYTPGNRILT